MAFQIEQLVAKYRSVSQFPNLTAARIIQKPDSQIIISSAWSQRCLEKGKNSKYIQSHLINGKNIFHTTPIDSSTELLSAWSPSGVLRAVLRELSNAEGGIKKQHLEIWSDKGLSKLVDLTLLDLHGEVYTSGEFSCFEWSPCEEKILYVAEKKQLKAEAFYPSKPKDKDSSVPEDKLPKKGEEYTYRQDWGETLAGKHQPVLCVCDLTSLTVSLPGGIPEEFSVGQALFVPDGIVGVAWSTEPRRLGIVYCTNRPSWVFHLNSDGVFTKLSGDGLGAHSPRLSPDEDYLVWLQRKASGPHHACHQLVKSVWGALPHVLVDTVDTVTKCGSGDFFGLYCQSLPARCFVTNKSLQLSTGQQTAVKSYHVNTETGELWCLQNEGGSLSVLDVSGDLTLCAWSRMDTPVSLVLRGPDESGVLRLRPVLQQEAVPPAFPSIHKHIFHMQADAKDSVRDFNAIYYGPSEGETKSIPLILWPHGGPHAMFFECYSTFNQFFVNAGFATLWVNYRGSTGQGQASVDFLPGRCGDADVKDCHQAALVALDKFPCLDPEKVVLYGGSHGGFLVTHLAGQYPEVYKAVVARNPVVDLPSILFESDISDWVVVEGGFTYTGREQVEMSPDFYSQLRRASPIQYADKVKAPTLLNIGKKDLRVPPSQGTLYYHTLNTYKIPCKMNLYDDNHSLSTVPVDIDATINAVLWFQKHLNLARN